MTICIQCTRPFNHLPGDLEFYRKHDFPEPIFCPDCRHQHRAALRNERTLYSGTCDACKKAIITHFSGDQSFPVYCSDCWWGDSWDGLSFGKDFDFSRSFFDQLFELQQVIPRPALNNSHSENADYCNQCVRNKNSYLLFAADDNEDSMYCYWINRCTDTFNSSNLADCTLCFDCIDCENCYHCMYAQDLKSSSECHFSFNLIGCKNCFACSGLRNKEYYIENTAHSKEEYERILQSKALHTYSQYRSHIPTFLHARTSIPHKYAHITNSVQCSGDYIINSKNCNHCFEIFDAEDSSYCYNLVHQHFNNRDVTFATETRNGYMLQSTTGEEMYFGTLTWYCSNTWYTDLVKMSHNMFGCIGLKHQKYCIFNKTYTPEAFTEMRNKIIEHMKKTGEWGQFFPMQHSPFAYNETVAQDFFPLSKEEVLARGWKWKDKNAKEFVPQSYPTPDNIRTVSEDVCNQILMCNTCKRNYKIMPYELHVYKTHQYPIPQTCHECRFHERLALRNPRILIKRNCAICSSEIISTYVPSRPEQILCEPCYLKALY